MGKNGIERNITCPLCHGYLIDAVTLQECTHFFCRRCFLLHLQREKTCPQCAIKLTDLKTAFFRDDVLQNLIYKLTPATYWREVELRADFIEKRVVTAEERRQIADLNLIQFQQHLIEKDELVEFCMAYITPEQLVEGNFDEEQPPPQGHEGEQGSYYKKYFRCKALVPLEDLKEILLAQVDLPENVIIAFIHEGSREVLLDKYTLQDVVYLFGWDRESSLRLFFTAMDAKPPVAEDEEQPPVLEMECSFDQREESMKSPPPLEQPEERVNMFPALTVNLSTAQCIPDMTLNGGTGTRIPIITQASEPAAKKRRRTGPKKEKAKKINSKQPIAPTSNNVVPPATTVSRENSVEWLVGTPKAPQQLPGSPLVNSTNIAPTASRPSSTTSNLSMPPAATNSPLCKPSSSMPAISKPSPPMSVASMLSPSPAASKSPQSVPTSSSQDPSSSIFAKPDPPMSMASLLSPSSSKASPAPTLSKQMFQNPLAAQLNKGTLIGIASERKSFLSAAPPEPCFAMPRISSAVSALGSKQTETTPPAPMPRFSMPLLSLPESTIASVSSNMTTSNHLMSTKMSAMSALTKPGFMPSTTMAATLNSLFPMQSNLQPTMPKLSSKPKPSMSLPLNLNPPTLAMASELNPPTLSKAIQSTSSINVDSPPPSLMQMESTPSSSKSMPMQPNQPTPSMPVLSRQLSNDPPPKRSSLMPTFSMPPLSSTSASMVIPPKTSSPLSNPMVAPLKSSKPTSYKMMPTSMKASPSVNPKPYEKQAAKKKSSTLSANGSGTKEKSATRSPRPFVMPRPQSPDLRSTSASANQQIQTNRQATPAVPPTSATAATVSNNTPETTNASNSSNFNNNDDPRPRPVSHWDQPKKREFIPFALRKEPKPKPILMKGETTPVVIPPWPFNKDAPRPTPKAKSAADEPSTSDTNPAVKSPTNSIRSPTRPSPTKQRPNPSSVNKAWNQLRNSPSKNIGSSIIPIMTDRVPLMMASKAGR
uniref:RING-type domain-containing protein n=1 Tax=Panagrellus redivivus TaxID=6233 RepID=A0A7E4W7W1_PANRE